MMKVTKNIMVAALMLVSSTVSMQATIDWQYGDPENQSALNISIRTENLLLRSVSGEDLGDIIALYSSSTPGAQFGINRPGEPALVRDVVLLWIIRAFIGDPRHGLSIFIVDPKTQEQTFGGCLVLGSGFIPGHGEIAGLMTESFSTAGYIPEAITAIIGEYIPQLRERGFTCFVEQGIYVLDAAATPDSVLAIQVLDNLGFPCARPDLPVYDPIQEILTLERAVTTSQDTVVKTLDDNAPLTKDFLSYIDSGSCYNSTDLDEADSFSNQTILNILDDNGKLRTRKDVNGIPQYNFAFVIDSVQNPYTA